MPSLCDLCSKKVLVVRPLQIISTKVAVVTGASSGIGAAIVEVLVKDGLQVVGLARRLNRLEELAEKLLDTPGQFHPYKCDISNEQELLAAFAWVETELGGVDILINNAGILNTELTLLGGSTQEFREIFDVNVLALCICNREAMKSMMARGVDGYIININSIVGHNVPGIGYQYHVYPASKFAVTAVTESLRKELVQINSKIRVTSISPGIVATEIFNPGGEIPDAFKPAPKLDPVDIANACIYVLGTPPHVHVTELTIRPIGEMI